MAAKYVPVRVLYMVQNNPQYMLARSPTSVPVFMVYNAPHPGSAPSIYGKTRLETCIQAINRSSPEFFSEDEEDYSVYLVDPVETQQSGSTLNNASSSNGVLPQFAGVTVGLGVLSTLLDSSAEDVWVTGTISTGPDGSESLEVVFTLKPMKRKPPPAVSQKKRSRKQPSASHQSQTTNHPPQSSQPLARSSSLTALEIKARNAKYYKSDASLPPPPILSGQAKSHYPVRSTSFPSQPPPQTKPATTYDFSSSTPQTSRLQTLLSVLSSTQNRNSVLSVLSLMDASKSSATSDSSGGSTSSLKGTDDAFALALRSLLHAAATTSASANSISPTNHRIALLAPPPNKAIDFPSPSSSGEDDNLPSKPYAASTPEDPSSTACVSPEVRCIEKGKATLDKENFHPIEHTTPSKSEKKRDGEKVLSPANSPSRPLGRYNTMTSPIRPIDVSSSSQRKRTISDVGDVNERVREKVKLLRGSGTAGPTASSFDDTLTDPFEGVKRRLFSLSSHYTAQYHSDPTFDSLPPSSSQGSTSSMVSDRDTKPPPSSSSSFSGSDRTTARIRNSKLTGPEPPSESSTTASTADPDGKKRFVVPDWAKTETATVPRLSQDTAAKLEAAEAEKVAQMKLNKRARSAAARKRKLEQMVAEDENIDRLPSSARSREKNKQVQSKPKAHGEAPALGLKNASNKPITPKRNKPGVEDAIDLPLVASSSPAIFNSSPLASRSGGLVLKTPTKRRRNSSRTPTKWSAVRAASESPLFTPDGTAGGITPKKLPSLFSAISPLRKGRKSPPILRHSSSFSVAKKVVIDLEQDEDEGSMNSLPNPSSDVDEPDAPVEPFCRLADPELLSSSPPPSSPIMTSSDVDLPQPEVVTSDTETTKGRKSELAVTSTPECRPPPTTDFQSSDNDFVDFMLQTTSSNSQPPTAPSPSGAKFASEIFDWGSDDTLAGSSSATPFDDFEFLDNSSLTQPLSASLGFDYGSLGVGGLGGLGDAGAEFEIGEFWQSVKPLMELGPLATNGTSEAGAGAGRVPGEEAKGGDGDKLASGMVDLFGGCLV
ncbi:hypothetical protein BJ322DRAFT_1067089 [Thelephora terrestris]|uniref:Ams2/SPT21 N-terminal domain-containing protein n=1 Tax=Thelephora terrestris TaxID=56493 RepID=A0A9P6L5Q5_9AGAM|nr:hypothetical protein BJ322DRAFT_1067089 [Thelephora terrestris]